ncbi:hypothetical protein PPMP20_19285 [Paraburkholderia phymatum]|uniref:Uncharacterized protein n=1 Tax=Paraburkholderia phymatum (strain DSM 17167 / CIP 108236 / LMG 21445 / STM815) TaxID=391038 RepID=B2JUN8_PARP8|nr:hypothetical protein [Paraburkholderia phymatum]ACC76209.1 hypothetical protein Bphy_7209 [Paraburkholderia phymatum STM815]
MRKPLNFAQSPLMIGATVMVAYHPYSLPVYLYAVFGGQELPAMMPLLPMLAIAVLCAALCVAWRSGGLYEPFKGYQPGRRTSQRSGQRLERVLQQESPAPVSSHA